MSEYYVDTRVMEIVKDLDTSFLAPELYYRYLRGNSDDIITESWVVGDNKRLNFSYLIKSKRPEGTDLDMERNAHFEHHGATKLYLHSYTVPPEWFDEETGDIDKSSDIEEDEF